MVVCCAEREDDRARSSSRSSRDARGNGRRAGKPLRHGCLFGTLDGNFVLMRLRGLANFADERRGFGHIVFRGFARLDDGLAFRNGMLGFLSGGASVAPKVFDLRLAGGQFRAEPRQFGARLIAFERRSDDFLSGFDVLQRHFFERAFRLLPFGFQPFDGRLQFGQAALQPRSFSFQRTQLAFGRQRTGFGRPAARDRAAVIAGSVR